MVDIDELIDRVEQVSRTYAARFGIDRDANWLVLKLQEEVGELTQAHLMASGQARVKGRTPATFGAEIADVLCQVLVLAHHHRIDVVEEVRKKWLVYAGDGSVRGE